LGIFDKACPRCTAVNAAGAMTCVCGYVFEAAPRGHVPSTPEQVAQEERLFEEYLSARVGQELELATVAVHAAELEPGNERKAIEALRAREVADAAKVELVAQRVRAARAAAIARSVSRARQRESAAHGQNRKTERTVIRGPTTAPLTRSHGARANGADDPRASYLTAPRTPPVMSAASTQLRSGSLDTDRHAYARGTQGAILAAGVRPVKANGGGVSRATEHADEERARRQVLEHTGTARNRVRRTATSQPHGTARRRNRTAAALKIVRRSGVVAKKLTVRGAKSIAVAAGYTAGKIAAAALELKKAQSAKKAQRVSIVQKTGDSPITAVTGGAGRAQGQQTRLGAQSSPSARAAPVVRAVESETRQAPGGASETPARRANPGKAVRRRREARPVPAVRQGIENVRSGAVRQRHDPATAGQVTRAPATPVVQQRSVVPKQSQVPSEAFRAAQAAKIAKAVETARALESAESTDSCPLCGVVLAANATGCRCGWQVPSAHREIPALLLSAADCVVNDTALAGPEECPVCTAALATGVARCGCGWLVPSEGNDLPSVALSSEERTALSQGTEIERGAKPR